MVKKMIQENRRILTETIYIICKPTNSKRINAINGPKAEPKSAKVLNLDNAKDLWAEPAKCPVMASKETLVPTLEQNNNV